MLLAPLFSPLLAIILTLVIIAFYAVSIITFITIIAYAIAISSPLSLPLAITTGHGWIISRPHLFHITQLLASSSLITSLLHTPLPASFTSCLPFSHYFHYAEQRWYDIITLERHLPLLRHYHYDINTIIILIITILFHAVISLAAITVTILLPLILYEYHWSLRHYYWPPLLRFRWLPPLLLLPASH